jgi:hypothetical protein
MKMVFHGGNCCGIKTIKDLGAEPDTVIGKVLESGKKPPEHDKVGAEVNSNLLFFTAAAPEETRRARLERMITFTKKHRPNGIIEITLSDFSVYDTPGRTNIHNQLTKWRPVLEGLGFVEVASCFNSNSSNRVHVFYLVMDRVG